MKPHACFDPSKSASTVFLAIALAVLPLVGCSSENSSSYQDNNPSAEANQAESTSNRTDNSASIDSSKNQGLDNSSIPAEAIISPEELSQLLNSDNPPFVLDIRNQGQFARGYIDGAKNIPAGRQLDLRFEEIPKDRMIVIASTKDERIGEVRQTLIDGGLNSANIKVLDGGMDAWAAANYPMEKKEIRGC